MRVCIITPEFTTERYCEGGIAQRFSRITTWLVKEGHDVHVIVFSDRTEDFNKDSIHIHQLCPKDTLFIEFLNRATFGKIKGTLGCLTFSWRAFNLVKKINSSYPIDITLSSNYHACGLFSLLFTKLPHLLSASSYRPAWNKAIGFKPSFDRKMNEHLEMLYYSLSKNTYASSVILKNMLTDNLGLKNVKVINPIFLKSTKELDDSIYRKELSGRQYILFFGRLQLHKGVHVLAQALPKVFEAHKDCYAVFVGPDTASPLGNSMREFIGLQNSKFRERIIFLDGCPHDKLYPIIQHARLVVLPSLIDNMPNTLAEAMGLGKVVIGTIGCSFDEVIEDGKDGFLVPPGNVDALAKKICEVWSRLDLKEIGEAAKRKSEQFAPEKSGAALVELFKEIIEKEHKKKQ